MKNRIDLISRVTNRDFQRHLDYEEICDYCGERNQPGVRINFDNYSERLYVCTICASGKKLPQK